MNVEYKYSIPLYNYKMRSLRFRMMERLIAWRRGRKRDHHDYQILRGLMQQIAERNANAVTPMPLYLSAHDARLILRKLPR